MNVTLWIIASLLAAVFVAVGATKLTTPREKLIPKMASVADFSNSEVKAVAAAEVLGAANPAVTPIPPLRNDHRQMRIRSLSAALLREVSI